ncbi:hypothetical protein BLNAU_20117 [Blattamonas nauphoetae]|uniref:Uncharacterized protein n=1 Tax=Blattamonas nauphoetae TaxID=2049346 RepID=A0ABQ9WZI6_9EUKA|nr:hypothetical protein BLNAU_20117 [Blattamonas nauphoetae]
MNEMRSRQECGCPESQSTHEEKHVPTSSPERCQNAIVWLSSARLSSSFVSDGVVSSDCSPFLSWDEKTPESEDEQAVIFRSLVATLKLQPALDDSLEAKAVKLLTSVIPYRGESVDAYLGRFGRTADDSLASFTLSIGVLLSSPNRAITTAMMKMITPLILDCLAQVRLALVKADLLPQIVITLNPQSLSFTEVSYIHLYLMNSIRESLWLATPDGFKQLQIEDNDGQQTVHETVLKQVLVPSEKYICHLCVNHFSIIDGDQSYHFLLLFAQLLRICPYYQPTMEFVLHMPVFFTIPSCLTFFEDDLSIWVFLDEMNNAQRKWNEQGGEVQQLWKTVHRMLRMEGFEDVMEEKLRNDKNESFGGDIVSRSIQWNNLLGINLPRRA